MLGRWCPSLGLLPLLLAMGFRRISAPLVARGIPGAMAVGSLTLSAYLVYVGVRALLQPAPVLQQAEDAKLKRKPRPEPEVDSATFGPQILARNIFDSHTGSIPWEPERAELAEGTEGEEQGAPAWVDCPSELRLLASVVSTQGGPSYVSVRAGEASRLMQVGDVIAGAELTSIEPMYAYLRLASGSSCALPLFLTGPAAAPRVAEGPLRPPRKPAFFEASTLDDAVTDLGAGRYKVRRDLADRARANGGTALVQGVKFKQRIKKGKVLGMHVTKIREDSLLYRLGVRKGDVLQTVNGFDLTGPDGLLSAYTALQGQNQLSLAVSNKGAKRNLQFTLEE